MLFLLIDKIDNINDHRLMVVVSLTFYNINKGMTISEISAIHSPYQSCPSPATSNANKSRLNLPVTGSFSDPLLALEHFKQTSNNHSLVITDMRMPGMCGIELAKKIREINQNVKIFLMTAFDIRDLKDNPDFRDANIDRLLQKPNVFSELRKMIDIDLMK